MSNASNHKHSSYLRYLMSFDMLSKEEEYDLIAKIKSSDCEKSKDKLVKAYTRLCLSKSVKVCRRYPQFELLELFSESCLGLLQSISKFDQSKGFRLSTFANYDINNRLMEFVLDNISAIRFSTNSNLKVIFHKWGTLCRELSDVSYDESIVQKIADKFNQPLESVLLIKQVRDGGGLASLDAVVGDDLTLGTLLTDSRANQESLLIDSSVTSCQQEVVEEMLTVLDPRQRLIIDNRWLKGNKTLGELSVELNVSRERIRQIEKQAFKTMLYKFYSNHSKNSRHDFLN